jgi:hypothetical protein
VRGRLRIVDPACLEVLGALDAAFEEEGLTYAVAGGMGVQALLAEGGLDHLLRRTGDVDVVVNGGDTRVVRALNRLAAAHQRLGVVQNPVAKNARVGPMNVDWINEPSRLRGMEAAFVPSIDHAHLAHVRGLELPIQEPEFLVAAKLTGQKIRPQDELDVAGVIQSGVGFDSDRVKELVRSHPGRFEAFLAIRDELAQTGDRR